jgi:hypothetical protein
MQVNPLTNENRHHSQQSNESLKVSGWLGRMFGCWHKEMSRPFSSEGQTYRACLTCGARRSFNPGRWEMRGGFYYSLPRNSHFETLHDRTPRQQKTNLQIVQPTRQFA